MISVTIQRESAKVFNIKEHSCQNNILKQCNCNSGIENNYNANENYMNLIKFIEYKWNLYNITE